jgi:RimJ/RimL family protein N-acetyltransferase
VHDTACGTLGITNLVSLRLAEKCGFTHGGVLRGLVFVGGGHPDHAVLPILRSAWEQGRNSAATHHAGK